VRELALHLMDIAENSASAGARTIEIVIDEDRIGDRLSLVVQDDGRGMEADLLARVTDPFVTTRTTRGVGLGIPLLKAAAEACGGYLRIESQPGRGTRLETAFRHSHIDRMPLGDVPGTLLALIVGSPAIHWRLRYRVDGAEFVFDDAPIKAELAGVGLSEPAVLAFLRQHLTEGIAAIQHTPTPECAAA
jgi:hypothetical protein